MHPLIRFTLIIGLLSVTGLCWGNTLKIILKASLAQALINNAWKGTLEGHPRPPWPWADTKPLAKIRNDKNGDTFIVLSGGKGNALAFGPAHVEGTEYPGHQGTSVIAGHRDTHFAFLENSQLGDQISIQSLNGKWASYEMRDFSIHDTRKSKVWLIDSELDQLLLVTCYPFDTLNPGGPLRLVVSLQQLVDFHPISPSILGPENRFVGPFK